MCGTRLEPIISEVRDRKANQTQRLAADVTPNIKGTEFVTRF
jgi:hypothetical protein